MYICDKSVNIVQGNKTIIFWGREEREEPVLYTGMFNNIK